jgi:predicted small lipoprotein YifL
MAFVLGAAEGRVSPEAAASCGCPARRLLLWALKGEPFIFDPPPFCFHWGTLIEPAVRSLSAWNGVTCLPHHPCSPPGDAGQSRGATRKAWIPATKAGMKVAEPAQLWFVQFWGRWGLYVKQSVNGWSRITVAAILIGAAGLAACGRKGPLDPPPSAALPQSQPASVQQSGGLGQEQYGMPSNALFPTAQTPPPPAPAPPPPQQKTFPLDFLLGK